MYTLETTTIAASKLMDKLPCIMHYRLLGHDTVRLYISNGQYKLLLRHDYGQYLVEFQYDIGTIQ